MSPRAILSNLLLAALLAGCSTPVPLADVARHADAVVDQAAARASFNGAVVLMRDGQVVYQRGVGLAQRYPDRPYTPTSVSDGASLAKTLTAAALWDLVADGRLHWDDPVVRYVPTYPYTGQTVRHLVTHRAGLPDYGLFDKDFAPGQVRGTVDLLQATARHQPRPVRPAGVQAEYDNLGFDTAVLVVERVTGRPIQAGWAERWFKPLGLQTMLARPARFADWPGQRTPGYRLKDGAWVLFDAEDGEGFIGGSNVHASALDWARWGDAFARGQALAAPRMDAGLQEPMLDSGLPSTLTRLSWYCDASRQRCHYTGAYNAFFTQVYWDRARREVVAYVSNSTLPPWTTAGLTRDLVDALAGRAATPESVPEPVRIASADLSRWAGRYQPGTLDTVRLDVQQGRFFVQVGQGQRVSVFQVTRQVFYAPMLDLWLAFSGTADAPTLHIRSVFHVDDARRLPDPSA
jgi:CubicO group peptidase (beta-lactamase class C family)